MYKKILLFFILCHTFSTHTKFNLFCEPDLLNKEEVIQRQKNFPMEMSFAFETHGKNYTKQVLSFFYKENATYLLFKFYGSREYFPTLIQEKFVQTTADSNDTNTSLYLYGFPRIDNENSIVENALLTDDYIIYEPRFISQEEASLVKQCSLEDFATIIKTKTLLFYTGAGISAQIVPTLDSLISSLNLNKITGKDMLNTFLIDVVTNSQHYINVMNAFYTSCFYGEPTSAHYALTALAENSKSKIITENLDSLHMHTGIDVPVAEAEWLRANFEPEDFKKIDVVVCVGLKMDERGFLGWYKHHNPKGIIIAINLEKPSYLGAHDLIVQGDVQKILPLIKDLVITTKKLEK